MDSRETMHDIMWRESEKVRATIDAFVAQTPVVPKHTQDAHFYEYMGEVYPSVTGITGLPDKPYLINWHVKVALDNLMAKLDAGQELNSLDIAMEYDTGKRLMNSLAETGTIAHNALEEYCNELIKNKGMAALMQLENPAANSSFIAGAKFIDDYHVIPVYPELLVASAKQKTAGTLDLLAWVAEEVLPPQVATPQREYWQVMKNGKEFVCIHSGKRIRYNLAIVDWKTSNSIVKPEYVMQPAVYRQCLIDYAGVAVSKMYVVRLDKHDTTYQVEEVERPMAKTALKVFKTLSSAKEALENNKLEYRDKSVTLVV